MLQMTSQDEKKGRAGRVRLPTAKEDADPDVVFHANAVLEVRPTPIVLPPLERHVAGFIDGFRPVARVRKKSGLSSDELIDALRALRSRGLLVLTGIIEATDDTYAPLDPDDSEGTIPRGSHDVIPPHVMLEIEAMLDEEDRLRRNEEHFDAEAGEFEMHETTEMETPGDDDDDER